MTATLVKANHNHIAVTVSLGKLLTVLPRRPWHTMDVHYRLQFEQGVMEFPAPALIDLVRRAQEALAATPRDADISGAAADFGEPA